MRSRNFKKRVQGGRLNYAYSFHVVLALVLIVSVFYFIGRDVHERRGVSFVGYSTIGPFEERGSERVEIPIYEDFVPSRVRIEIVTEDGEKNFAYPSVADFSTDSGGDDYYEYTEVYPPLYFELKVLEKSEDDLAPRADDSTRVYNDPIVAEDRIKAEAIRESEGGSFSGSSDSTPSFVSAATCSDGIQNQGEEDVDCGGPCDACEDDGLGGFGFGGGGCGVNCLSYSLTGRTVGFVEVDLVHGKVSAEEPFSYELKVGELAELVLGSVRLGDGTKVSDSAIFLKLEDGKVVVRTDYKEIKKYLPKKKVALDPRKTGITGAGEIRVFEDGKLIAEEDFMVPEENLGMLELYYRDVKINEPVEWTGSIEFDRDAEKKIVAFDLPSSADNILVLKYETFGDADGDEGSVTGVTGNAIVRENDISKSNEFVVAATPGKNIEKIDVSFESDGPTMDLVEKENALIMNIRGAPDFDYRDVELYADISQYNLKSVDDFKVYWVEGTQYVNDFESVDSDGDGFFEKLNFVMDIEHESTKTYELIFVVSAEHLDSSKNFISSIYSDVVELDGDYSEVINDGDYVSLVFERELSSENDIRVYPRIVSGSPNVEVHESKSGELIGEFGSLTDGTYNQFLLGGLEEASDSFDLRVIGGAVEFDQIIDPSGICSGTPDSCSVISSDDCGLHPGCELGLRGDSFCSGTHAPCSDFITRSSCEIHSCSWSGFTSLAPMVSVEPGEVGDDDNNIEFTVIDDGSVNVKIYAVKSGSGVDLMNSLVEETGEVSAIGEVSISHTVDALPTQQGADNFVLHFDVEEFVGEELDETPGFTHSGKFAGSYDFDGNDDYVSRSYSTNYLDATFSIWVKREGGTVEQTIASLNYGANPKFRMVSSEQTTWPACSIMMSDGEMLEVFAESKVLDNNWHNIVCTTDVFSDTRGVQVRLSIFYDGEFIDSEIIEHVPGNYQTDRIFVGADGSTSESNFNGLIDDVVVWGRVLSNSEIRNIYRAESGSYDWKAVASDGTSSAEGIGSYTWSNPSDPTPISSCGTISQSGYYILDRNIIATGGCFTITKDNVVLDGNGHRIIGNGLEDTWNSGDIGVFVYGSRLRVNGEYVTTTANNVLVRNLKVENFERGIVVSTVGVNAPYPIGTRIEDNDISSSLVGIWVIGGKNHRITGNVIDEKVFGLNLVNSIGTDLSDDYGVFVQDNIVTGDQATPRGDICGVGRGVNVEAIGNSHFLNNHIFHYGCYSIELTNSYDNVFQENTFADFGYNGIKVGVGTANNVFSQSNIYTTRDSDPLQGQDQAGISFEGGSENVFSDNMIDLTGIGYDGISFEDSSTNLISGGTIILGDGDSISIEGTSPNNILSDVKLIRKEGAVLTSESRDLKIVSATDSLILEDMDLNGFNLGAGAKVTIRSSTFGEIEFIDSLTADVPHAPDYNPSTSPLTDSVEFNSPERLPQQPTDGVDPVNEGDTSFYNPSHPRESEDSSNDGLGGVIEGPSGGTITGNVISDGGGTENDVDNFGNDVGSIGHGGGNPVRTGGAFDGKTGTLIQISNNFVYVDSLIGADTLATVTLKNVRGRFDNPVIYRNGEVCSVVVCGGIDWVGEDGQDAKFLVSGFSSYEIGEGEDELPTCEDLGTCPPPTCEGEDCPTTEKEAGAQLSPEGNYLPQVTLVSPLNGEVITDRLPAFIWSGSDGESQPLKYELSLTLVSGSGCIEEDRNVRAIETQYYIISDELSCFADDNNYYVWKVRAFDGDNYGEWSEERTLKINSVLGVSATENSGELIFENVGNLGSDIYLVDKLGGREVRVKEVEGYSQSFDLKETLNEQNTLAGKQIKIVGNLNYLPKLNRAAVSVENYKHEEVKFRVRKAGGNGDE